ncbi:MAG: hypothetical protein ACK4OO_01130 [bacterium]
MITRGLVALLMLISGGCKEQLGLQKPQGWKFERGNLPEKINIPSAGTFTYITTQALVDSIKSGKAERIYFVKEFDPENPEWIVPIPGMKQELLPNMYSYLQDTPPDGKPYYLLCLFGDDSKRLAEHGAKYGHIIYYLDGGMYRLWKDIRSHKWVFP